MESLEDKPEAKTKLKAKWNTLEVWDCLIVMLLMAIWMFTGFSDGSLPGISPAVTTGLGIFTPIYMVYFAICLMSYKKSSAIQLLGAFVLAVLGLLVIVNVI